MMRENPNCDVIDPVVVFDAAGVNVADVRPVL
jgi:hypothetical protein